MPRKAVKKTKKRSSSRKTSKISSQSITYNKFFGSLLIAIGVGALIVFVRYLVVTWVAPADVYLVEPSSLIPGEVAR